MDEKEYVIICADQLSNRNSFLFWKPEAKGYTCDINKAGVWFEIPKGWKMQDIVIEKKKLLEMFETETVVGESMIQVIQLADEEIKIV